MPAGDARRPESPEMDVVRVYYGTDRRPTGKQTPNDFYGSERGEMQIGFCDVSIPPGHHEGEVERPKIWKLELSENPDKHVVLLRLESVDGNAFLSELKRTVAASDAKEAFLFVHGYNVSFDDAARRTAQIAHDLRFDGAPVLFSWPSHGEAKNYVADGDQARWAENDLAIFLHAIARFSGARKFHLIAHSMGNRVLTGALARIAQDPGSRDLPKFNQVVLTAPDLDAQTFKEDLAPKIVQTAQRVTIYTSSHDNALSVSKFVHADSRLGLNNPFTDDLSIFRSIDVVDASEVDLSLFGHSYYGSNTTVLDDLRGVFRGLKTSERGLAADTVGSVWRLLSTSAAAPSGTRVR